MSHSEDASAGRANTRVPASVAGAALVLTILHVVFALIAPRFEWALTSPTQLIPVPVVLGVASGALYLFCVYRMPGLSFGRAQLWFVIGVGLILRLTLFPSVPVLEDDVYRYLWDGAVTAEGRNPYAHAPDEAAASNDETLRRLADEAGGVGERINHPNLRTIYPPLGQAAFVIAHELKPWSILAWRSTLLLFDVATLVLLWRMLKAFQLPLLGLVIYWWNPVLVRELYNSNHVDIVAMPFVLGGLFLAARRKSVGAAVMMAVAAGAKVWPVLLLPLVLRPLLSEPRKLLAACALSAAVLLAMVVPVYAGGLDQDSGFIAYGRYWEMNDALFMLFLWSAQLVLKVSGADPEGAQLLARVVVACLLGAFVLWSNRKTANTPTELFERALLTVAVLFLFSPTGFPWYYIWLVPLLALRPRFSLLLLTALLPLYYLRFLFDDLNLAGWFDNGVVWLEILPVVLLLGREQWRRRGVSRAAAGAVG